MNLSEEKWTQISLGDLDGLLESDPSNSELKIFLENRRTHLKSNDSFKELYGWKKSHTNQAGLELLNISMINQGRATDVSIYRKAS